MKPARYLLILFIISRSVSAETDGALEFFPDIPLTSEMSIATSFDSANGRDSEIATSLAIPFDMQLELALGDSVVESDEAELQTGLWSVGVYSDPLADFSAGIANEWWGDSNVLTINTWRGELTYAFESFSFSLIPQQRSVRLYVRQRFRTDRSYFEVDSRDIGVNLAYYGVDKWLLSAGYTRFDYSRDVSRLAEDFRLIFIFTPETLSLASGLDKEQFSIGARYLFTDAVAGFSIQRNQSALTGDTTITSSLYGSLDLSRQWRLNLQGGWQDVIYDDSTVFFAGAGIAYRW